MATVPSHCSRQHVWQIHSQNLQQRKEKKHEHTRNESGISRNIKRHEYLIKFISPDRLTCLIVLHLQKSTVPTMAVLLSATTSIKKEEPPPPTNPPYTSYFKKSHNDHKNGIKCSQMHNISQPSSYKTNQT